MKPQREISIISFGEVLLDKIGDTLTIGGAPLNISYHLQKLGLNAHIISRVGSDSLGEKIIEFIQLNGIGSQGLSIDKTMKTGLVHVELNKDGEILYDIQNPAAWDYIADSNIDHACLVVQADALVFGTLSSRNTSNRTELFRMLGYAKMKVFDVNFRQPFVDKVLFEKLFSLSDLVKFNLEEIKIVAEWYGVYSQDLKSIVDFLNDKYGEKEILVTDGENGAYLFFEGEVFFQEAIKVQVVDTIGCGDAFLAGYLSCRLKGDKINASLANAIKLSALVATKEGGCPTYKLDEMNQ